MEAKTLKQLLNGVDFIEATPIITDYSNLGNNLMLKKCLSEKVDVNFTVNEEKNVIYIKQTKKHNDGSISFLLSEDMEYSNRVLAKLFFK